MLPSILPGATLAGAQAQGGPRKGLAKEEFKVLSEAGQVFEVLDG